MYKIIVAPLLSACEAWMMRKSVWNKIQEDEMKYLRSVEGWPKVDSIKMSVTNWIYPQLAIRQTNGKAIFTQNGEYPHSIVTL